MPFEVIETLDGLTDLIEFKTSALYELIISPRTLLKPTRWHEAFAARARAVLSPQLYDDLLALYKSYHEGGPFIELPVDYPDHSNVPGFFAYVLKLSDVEFLYYLLGRVFAPDELRQFLKSRAPIDAIRSAFSTFSERYEWYADKLDMVLTDIGGFKKKLVKLWEQYWTLFLSREIETLEPQWTLGIQEKQAILSREGGKGLLEKVIGKAELPIQIPNGMPYTSITFTPVYLLPSRVYQFFGYGNVTVLFDPRFNEARIEGLKMAKQEASATLKALDDERRLEILRLIAQHGGKINGKAIAERLNISPSAVSRHLALLQEGNLIVEEQHKNTITYQFQRETLSTLVEKLFDYLYG